MLFEIHQPDTTIMKHLVILKRSLGAKVGVEPRLCGRGRRIARAILYIAVAQIMRDSINSGEGKRRST